MTSPRYLTKSRFKLAAGCPTKLYYSGKDKVYRNTMQEDSFLAALAEGGYQVGELAKCYYPDGIEVESLNHADAEAQTAELLTRDKVVIFEPAIRHGSLFARIDILVKEGNNYQLIEVKAKSYNSEKPAILGAKGDISSDMRPYIEDVAFQAHVFRLAYPTARLKTFLMMPDKAVPASVSGLNQLFKIQNVTGRTKVVTNLNIKPEDLDKNILALVPVDSFVDMVNKDGVHYLRYTEQLSVLADRWAAAYQADQKIKPDPGGQCGSCEFKTSSPTDSLKSGFKECWAEAYHFTEDDFKQGTVLDVFRFRGKDKLIADGRVRISSITPEDITEKNEGEHLSTSERQWMQIRGIPPEEDRGGYWVAEKAMRDAMSKWTYPYHFIDFETSAVAIPFHAGMRPFEPVAFQFSHHVMHEDGRVEHAGEFLLADPGVFPNFEFAQALKKELDKDNGTVFMWSGHENTILNKIIEQLENAPTTPENAQDLINFLRSLVKSGNRAMFDLCQLSRDAFFQAGIKGSSSIKKVLPAILKSSLRVREKYSSSIYGAANGIPSKNFKNFSWWIDDGSGQPIEPYSLLKHFSADLADEEAIAEGGAAATAYARLQFEEMDASVREKTCQALLRYCELDTLAMVMIVEAWQEFVIEN